MADRLGATKTGKIMVAASAMAIADGYNPNEVTTIPMDMRHPTYRWQHYVRAAKAVVSALEKSSQYD